MCQMDEKVGSVSDLFLIPMVEDSIQSGIPSIFCFLPIESLCQIILRYLCKSPFLAMTIKTNSGLRMCCVDPDDFGFAEGAHSEDASGAFMCQLRLAKRGWILSLIRMGYRHEVGFGCKRNCFEAYRWYAKAAEAGDKHTKDYLRFWRPTPEVAMIVPALHLAAECGSALASYNLARMYGKGELVRSDKKKSKDLVKIAAQQGFYLVSKTSHLFFFFMSVCYCGNRLGWTMRHRKRI